MNSTPQANRLHIGIYGKCNSGKSSLINALSGQYAAVVSDVAGTTTDTVGRSMEMHGVGACTLMDTAGFDDESPLGKERLKQTLRAVERTDIALLLFCGGDIGQEAGWADMFRARKIPVIAVISRSDAIPDAEGLARDIERRTKLRPATVSSVTGSGLEGLVKAIANTARETDAPDSILGGLVSEGDVVMLVMPQDAQAPRGRLILPQAQVIRELLDRRCIVAACVTGKIEATLSSLAAPPKLVITDSQALPAVSGLIPEESGLTTFSVLFARYKGDVRRFAEGAAAIGRLTENSRVLVAEACAHAPLEEDIGREKIPRMLRARTGEGLRVDVVSGSDFPSDLSDYDLVIHCGACMFNRRHVLSRIAQADAQGIPITNYGIAIAWLTSLLDKVVWEF